MCQGMDLGESRENMVRLGREKTYGRWSVEALQVSGEEFRLLVTIQNKLLKLLSLLFASSIR